MITKANLNKLVKSAEKDPELADTIMDCVLVDLIGESMRKKLFQKRSEGRCGWWNKSACSIDDLKRMLADHIQKGDMVDVMNFAAMIYLREYMDSDNPQEGV